MTGPLRVPWEFDIPKGDGTDIPNEPTEAGRAAGASLAAAVDIAEEQQRQRVPNMLPRCNECALRAGTLPNSCESTLREVAKCAIEGLPFYCHKGLVDGEQPKRLCTGAMVLGAALHKDPVGLERLVRRWRNATPAARKRRRQAARARGAR